MFGINRQMTCPLGLLKIAGRPGGGVGQAGPSRFKRCFGSVIAAAPGSVSRTVNRCKLAALKPPPCRSDAQGGTPYRFSRAALYPPFMKNFFHPRRKSAINFTVI